MFPHTSVIFAGSFRGTSGSHREQREACCNSMPLPVDGRVCQNLANVTGKNVPCFFVLDSFEVEFRYREDAGREPDVHLTLGCTTTTVPPAAARQQRVKHKLVFCIKLYFPFGKRCPPANRRHSKGPCRPFQAHIPCYGAGLHTKFACGCCCSVP